MCRIGKISAVIISGLLLFCTALYLARRPIATWLLTHDLDQQGVESSVVIERLGFAGAVMKLRLGRPSAPDLTIQQLVVALDWQGLSPHITAINIYHPVLRVQFDGRTLSFGALQNLIGSSPARGAPQRIKPAKLPRRYSIASAGPDSGPTISVQNAWVSIATSAGTLRIFGSGAFSGGRVRNLTARAEPMTLRGHDIAGIIRRADLSGDSIGRLHINVAGELAVTNGAKPIALSGATAAIAIAALRWNANSRGGLRFGARLRANLRATQVDAGGVTIHSLLANLQAAGEFDTNGATDITGAMTISGTMPAEVARAQAARIPVLGSDPVTRRALAEALRQVELRADSVHLLRKSDQTYVVLAKPVAISGNGASLQLSAARGPLVHAVAGILRGAGKLHFAGAHLPTAWLTFSSYTWQNSAAGSAFDADASIQAGLSLAVARNASISADGTMTWRNDQFTFALDHCADIAVKAVTLKNRRIASDAALRLCASQPGEALFSTSAGQWSVQGTWQSLSARLPAAKLKLASPHGTLVFSRSAGAITGLVTLARARLSDLAHVRRFAPIIMSGRVTAKSDALHGKFLLAGIRTKTVGIVTLAASAKAGRGKAEIRVHNLSFNPGVLQPGDLSPMLAPLTRVKGTAGFIGNFAWTPRGFSSGGVLTVQNLDFIGPPGALHNVNGRVRFTSLVPLRTAPDQTISVSKVDWVTPLTNLSVTLQLRPERLEIQRATADLSGGQVSLDPLALSLSPGAGTQGELRLHKIDIGALIAASNLSSKVKASARISGTVPFRYGPEGLRLVEGHVATIGPGRLSIAPGVWSAEQPTNGPGAIRGFAYQALEHLAIDNLDGTVGSLPNGRLQLLLHIQGYYDPEKPRAAEVGLIALLRGKAFDKAVPLPKGTKVNLTLDMSLNFAELLAEYRRTWAESLAGNAAVE